jgi:hypothetical protein
MAQSLVISESKTIYGARRKYARSEKKSGVRGIAQNHV